MKITTKRYLDTDKIRDLCIDNNYYTCGDCEEYSAMFGLARRADANKPEDIYQIALNIFMHSTLSKYPGEYTEYELIAGIMYGLYNDCTYTLLEIED